ncbi:hypothetical protein [Solimonas flava]|nr:hypothetical protein [Solimonas flava]
MQAAAPARERDVIVALAGDLPREQTVSRLDVGAGLRVTITFR